MTQVSLNINERLCYSCGKNTRNPIYCCKCYNKTPAGRVEMKREVMMRKYARLDGGASLPELRALGEQVPAWDPGGWVGLCRGLPGTGDPLVC